MEPKFALVAAHGSVITSNFFSHKLNTLQVQDVFQASDFDFVLNLVQDLGEHRRRELFVS